MTQIEILIDGRYSGCFWLRGTLVFSENGVQVPFEDRVQLCFPPDSEIRYRVATEKARLAGEWAS